MTEWGEKPESSGSKSSSEAVLKLTVTVEGAVVEPYTRPVPKCQGSARTAFLICFQVKLV